MQKRAKIGTVVAGMIAALAVGGAVAPQAQAAGNEERACRLNIVINETHATMDGHALHELQHRPHTIQQLIVAEVHRRDEEQAAEIARQLFAQGRYAECAVVKPRTPHGN
ncbi:hypothetical protein AB0I10_22150 [Streptomyces sp. NPDC050636]|uniref:hypothetical protein n=1 Tax=Streptomyces sp. NPDC050636 TaxID=3154510 RepID=UPI00341FA244